MGVCTMIIFSVFLCLISLWIRWRKRRMDLFQRYGIPGPKPNFFYGNLIEFIKGRDKCIEDWLKQYGKIFGFFLGAKPFVVCADVQLLKLIQIKDNSKFYNKETVMPDAGGPHSSVYNMLVLQKDEKWKNLRSILSTCFSTGKIKMMSTLMSKAINIFLKNIEKQREQPFNIDKLCKTLAFDIICTSAFGVTTSVQNNETSKFVESVHVAFETDSSDILAAISICFPETEPIPTFLRHKFDNLKYMLNRPSLTMIYETCKNIVTVRRKLEQRPHDLLQTLIDAEDDTLTEMKKLPDDFVIANAMMFMAVGNDTTSVTLIWCIHHLARNPEIQEKIRQEIKNNVSDDVDIQYSDLINFQLLDHVISETLRFWPFSSLVVTRICAEDYHYKDITIPEGAIVIAPVQVLQNDQEYWKEPDKFDPYRFFPQEGQKIDSISYQPFGAGHRICIGQRLAKTIVRLVLANLIRSFKLEACGDEKMEKEYSLFITYPKNGVVVKAIPVTS